MIILGLGYVASTKLGREFMPELDEQSMMEMPTTVPRASIAEVTRDIRVRDEILRGFPEVWQVVGKAGRAETPTDSAPLDMIETLINLRDHAVWPKRKLRYEDALAQTRVVLDELAARGLVREPRSSDEREALTSEAVMTVIGEVDDVLRELAARRLADFRPELGRALVGDAIDALIARVEPSAVSRKLEASERSAFLESLAGVYGERLAAHVFADDVVRLLDDARTSLIKLGVFHDRPDLLTPKPPLLERAALEAGDLLGLARPSFAARIAEQLGELHERRLKEKVQSLNWEIFDRAVGATNAAAIEAIMKQEGAHAEPGPAAITSEQSQAIRAALDKPFAGRLLLWQKTKSDLQDEMSTALQMPGWGNSFTQPIANRIEMLSTGVRLPVAVKVFGSDLNEIQRVSRQIAGVLRGCAARRTCSRIRSPARATWRSRSTARRQRVTG